MANGGPGGAKVAARVHFADGKVATLMGTSLEWYDYFIYEAFAD